MRDVFEWIDDLDLRFNMLRDPVYMQRVVGYLILFSFVMWAIFGFDSGVGMLEIWKSNFGINWGDYGKSLHWSSFIIYGLLFIGISKYISELGIEKSKNVFYSAFLSLLNVAIFEWVYMITFTSIHLNRNLLEWFVSDFWFLQQYLLILILGLLALFSLWVDGFYYRFGKRWRNYSFKPDANLFWVVILTIIAFRFWVLYPFPFEQVAGNLFPQTNYAYIGDIYVQNDLVHAVNVIVKSLIAFSQYVLTRCFR